MALVGAHTTYLFNGVGGSAGGHVPEPWPAILPCLSHDTLLCRVSLDLPTMRARRQMDVSCISWHHAPRGHVPQRLMPSECESV